MAIIIKHEVKFCNLFRKTGCLGWVEFKWIHPKNVCRENVVGGFFYSLCSLMMTGFNRHLVKCVFIRIGKFADFSRVIYPFWGRRFNLWPLRRKI